MSCYVPLTSSHSFYGMKGSRFRSFPSTTSPCTTLVDASESSYLSLGRSCVMMKGPIGLRKDGLSM